MASERTSERAFFGVSALLFAASAAVTIVWCASMSAMGGMSMPGGWTMSMAWMRMPGQALCRSDRDPPGHRGHGPSRDGGRDGSHHRRNVSHRPVSAWREPSGSWSSGQGCF
jgi:hypothetical protein